MLNSRDVKFERVREFQISGRRSEFSRLETIRTERHISIQRNDGDTSYTPSILFILASNGPQSFVDLIGNRSNDGTIRKCSHYVKRVVYLSICSRLNATFPERANVHVFATKQPSTLNVRE